MSRERGTVYRVAAGRLVEIVDETEETPGRHGQGGWSQARYQRHIEHLVQQHLKTVGQEIDKQARRTGGLQLVIVAPDELRSEIESTLSTEAREAVVGWATAESHAAPTELLAVVRPLLDEARARGEQEELERWQEEHGRGGRAAAGWKQTLDAASDGRVAVLLVDRELGRPRGVGRARSAVAPPPTAASARSTTRGSSSAPDAARACDPPRDRARRLRRQARRQARSATPPGIGAILRY